MQNQRSWGALIDILSIADSKPMIELITNHIIIRNKIQKNEEIEKKTNLNQQIQFIQIDKPYISSSFLKIERRLQGIFITLLQERKSGSNDLITLVQQNGKFAPKYLKMKEEFQVINESLISIRHPNDNIIAFKLILNDLQQIQERGQVESTIQTTKDSKKDSDLYLKTEKLHEQQSELNKPVEKPKIKNKNNFKLEADYHCSNLSQQNITAKQKHLDESSSHLQSKVTKKIKKIGQNQLHDKNLIKDKQNKKRKQENIKNNFKHEQSQQPTNLQQRLQEEEIQINKYIEGRQKKLEKILQGKCSKIGKAQYYSKLQKISARLFAEVQQLKQQVDDSNLDQNSKHFKIKQELENEIKNRKIKFFYCRICQQDCRRNNTFQCFHPCGDIICLTCFQSDPKQHKTYLELRENFILNPDKNNAIKCPVSNCKKTITYFTNLRAPGK